MSDVHVFRHRAASPAVVLDLAPDGVKDPMKRWRNAWFSKIGWSPRCGACGGLHDHGDDKIILSCIAYPSWQDAYDAATSDPDARGANPVVQYLGPEEVPA